MIPVQSTEITHVANGVDSRFAFEFKIFDSSHLEVSRADQTGLLQYPGDYTVLGVGASTGGTVVLNSVPPNGTHVTIRLRPPLQQPINLRNQGDFYPETIEEALDRVTQLVQVLDADLAESGMQALDATSWDGDGRRIANLSTPSAPYDAATKAYVDAVAGTGQPGGGGGILRYTTATRPTAAVDSPLIRVKDANMPETLQVALCKADGVTFEWVTIAIAPF